MNTIRILLRVVLYTAAAGVAGVTLAAALPCLVLTGVIGLLVVTAEYIEGQHGRF